MTVSFGRCVWLLCFSVSMRLFGLYNFGVLTVVSYMLCVMGLRFHFRLCFRLCVVLGSRWVLVCITGVLTVVPYMLCVIGLPIHFRLCVRLCVCCVPVGFWSV